MNTRVSKKLRLIYNKLYAHFGPRGWWPGDTPFEVMAGAILTQNTAWKNVEKAISNLKKERILSLRGIRKVSEGRLAELITPSGYYNQKAKRLKCLIRFIDTEFGGNLKNMLSTPALKLRGILLGVNGIGPETADSIVLYAAEKPIFVVDAYTKRILLRHSLAGGKDNYDSIQKLFMENLPRNVPLYNEYHALLVATGNNYCRKKPLCHLCPLRDMLPKEKIRGLR